MSHIFNLGPSLYFMSKNRSSIMTHFNDIMMPIRCNLSRTMRYYINLLSVSYFSPGIVPLLTNILKKFKSLGTVH